jgi:spore cortex formation protein SpoVR/YcgB (stage V sporulation)
MDAGDYRMIVRWVTGVLADEHVAQSPRLLDACHTLMNHAWSRLHPNAESSSETHAKTREES